MRLAQIEVEKQLRASTDVRLRLEKNKDVDSRSLYIGNVDYGATAEEVEQHFHDCGIINRVTILCNKDDGHPKGFAYVEFADKNSAQRAMALDETLLRGRQLKVLPKRTNHPGFSSTYRPPRGRGSYRGGMRGLGFTRRPRGSFSGSRHSYPNNFNTS